MERRGRIPVAKFRTQEGKTRSRSRVREPDYNETDPETDLFTLLEDNIALKEANKALQQQIEEERKNRCTIQDQNNQLKMEIDDLKITQESLKSSVKDNQEKLQRTSLAKIALENANQEHLNKVKLLSTQLKNQEDHHKKQISTSNFLEVSAVLKDKISSLFPTLGSIEMESLADFQNDNCTLSVDSIERILDEFIQMKSSLNYVELQLYEANEKISDLMENHQHLEEENENLRSENSNLTRVAQLLTENMKESVKTSKKMENALIKLKQRNDELTQHTKDIIDAPVTPTSIPPSPNPCTVEKAADQAQDDLRNQNLEHGERIVEMKTLVEEALSKSTNEEIKVLLLKLEIMEKELQKAISRAEMAENELENYKKQSMHDSDCTKPSSSDSALSSAPTVIPIPPPPPIPPSLLFPMNRNNYKVTQTTLHDNIRAQSLKSTATTDKCNTQPNQQVESTGLDALVREFKSGKVTLRRARRKTRTNDALQEMFQVLEISQQRNRNSKIIIDMHNI